MTEYKAISSPLTTHFKLFAEDSLKIEKEMELMNKNQMFYESTKNIDVKYHFVRDVIMQGKVDVKKVHTIENPTNILTKTLSSNKFKHCLNLINLWST
ncbi:unnamed protein product [Spirodela intermedia]|uniref:Uncharacterized protein n=1 Tax=Spirodela intermedia TaxID=51605 RepID=A0A7I8IIJ4_SPIIN|nr:unnamed protein product [Spirodela intermedia]CAA6656774.1 unnamed protein product [Spirodela intermedia]